MTSEESKDRKIIRTQMRKIINNGGNTHEIKIQAANILLKIDQQDESELFREEVAGMIEAVNRNLEVLVSSCSEIKEEVKRLNFQDNALEGE